MVIQIIGTHYHPTLDPAVLWTPSNDTSKPICSDSFNLMPPAPLYLRTLWRYTNAVIFYYYCNDGRYHSNKNIGKLTLPRRCDLDHRLTRKNERH